MPDSSTATVADSRGVVDTLGSSEGSWADQVLQDAGRVYEQLRAQGYSERGALGFARDALRGGLGEAGWSQKDIKSFLGEAPARRVQRPKITGRAEELAPLARGALDALTPEWYKPREDAAPPAGEVGKTPQTTATAQTLHNMLPVLGGDVLGAVVGAPVKALPIAASAFRPFAVRVPKAMELERLRLAPEEIYNRTGLYRGADGYWRGFQPDQQARMADSPENLVDKLLKLGPKARLPDILRHDELFRTVPQLRKTKVELDMDMGKGSAAYSHRRGTMIVGPESLDTPAPALHETTHALQGLFGLNKGGSPMSPFQAAKGWDPSDYKRLIADTSQELGRYGVGLADAVRSDGTPTWKGMTLRQVLGPKGVPGTEIARLERAEAERAARMYADWDQSMGNYQRIAGETEAFAHQGMFEQGKSINPFTDFPPAYEKFPRSQQVVSQDSSVGSPWGVLGAGNRRIGP